MNYWGNDKYTTNMKKKYFAFISYSHKDLEMAKWLQHELEYYELPVALFEKRKELRKEDFPESFRPVFRDEDELAGGELKSQIIEALADSEYLIVVCSPNAVASDYVDSEIQEFIRQSEDNKKKIFPFIIEGKPHQNDNKKMECFPNTLRKLSEDKTASVELIAGDINVHETGKGHAFVKIVAGMLREKTIKFADLWDRYEYEKAKNERIEREKKEKLQIAQSRFLSEKATQLFDEGDSYTARLLAIEALPKDIDNSDRPYVPEAEMILRTANQFDRIVLRHQYSVKCAKMSPDDKLIATATNDNCIYIWSLRNGRQIYRMEGHFDFVNDVSFNSNGTQLVSASGHNWSRAYAGFPKDYSIRIWDVKTGKEVRKMEGHSRKVNYVRFCKKDECIVSSSDDNTVRIWDAKTGKEIKSFSNCILLDHILEPLIAEYNDDSLIWWSPELPNKKYKMAWHKNETPKLMNPQRNVMVSTSYDEHNHIINFWDIETGCNILSLKEHSWKNKNLAFSPDGKRLIYTSDSDNLTVRVWDIAKGEELECIKITSMGESVAFSHDGKMILFSEEKKVYIRSNENNYAQGTLKCSINLNSICFSPDGNQFVVADGHNIKFFDIKGKTEIGRIKVPGNRVQFAQFSPNGEYVIASLEDKTIRVWDVLTCEERLTIDDSGFFSSAYVNGELSLVVMNNKSINIWNINDGAKLQLQIFTSEKNISMAVHPDKMIVAVTQKNGCIQLLNLLSGEEVRSIKTNIHFMKAISFDPKGDFLACESSNSHIYVIDVNTGKECRDLEGHRGFVNSIVYSKDGKYILTASYDKTIRIWDSESGHEVMKNEGLPDFVIDASFHPVNPMIATISMDGTIHLWDFPSLQVLIDSTKKRFENRQLSLDERRKYYLE